MNSLSDCIQANCTLCGGCGCDRCESLPIADVPTRSRVSANTTLLGTDSYGYTISQILAYLNPRTTTASLAKFTATTNTDSLGVDYSLYNVFGCTDTTSPVTLTLSSALLAQGSISSPVFVNVKDETGGASSEFITIEAESSTLIDGVGSIDITSDYGSLSLYSDGSGWFTL